MNTKRLEKFTGMDAVHMDSAPPQYALDCIKLENLDNPTQIVPLLRQAKNCVNGLLDEVKVMGSKIRELENTIPGNIEKKFSEIISTKKMNDMNEYFSLLENSGELIWDSMRRFFEPITGVVVDIKNI